MGIFPSRNYQIPVAAVVFVSVLPSMNCKILAVFEDIQASSDYQTIAVTVIFVCILPSINCEMPVVAVVFVASNLVL